MSRSSVEEDVSKPLPDQEAKVRHMEYIEFLNIPDCDQLSPQPDLYRHMNNSDDTKFSVKHNLFSFNPPVSPDILDTSPDLMFLSSNARAHNEAEGKLTLAQGCRLYPKAIAWSILLSATIIMEGFDLTLINSFQAFPIFRQTFGKQFHGQYDISAAWQSGLQNGAIAGEIIGLFLNGWITERFGYQKTMMMALIWMCGAVLLALFSEHLPMLLASQILCGIPWGVFQTLSMTYASEVMPIVLRSYLLSNINLCWLIGQITAVGVLRGLIKIKSKWMFKLSFGLELVFAVPILIAVMFAPDSPWWLVRHERVNEARKALLRLTSKTATNFNLDEAVAMLQHTNEVEKYFNESGSRISYRDCFKGSNLRRTEIACMVWASQALCGVSLTGWAAYYYEQAGFDTESCFDLSIAMYALGILGSFLSWVLIPKIGRRRLYLVGLCAMQLVLTAGGVLGMTLPGKAAPWAIGSLLIVLTGIYDITVGPVCYVLVAEVPSTRLRTKTVVLARVLYNLISLLTTVITSRMLNPTSWHLGAKSNFIFAGTNLICLVWCYYRLPETGGLSYLELDILFEKKAMTKKFKELQTTLASYGYFSISGPACNGNSWADR